MAFSTIGNTYQIGFHPPIAVGSTAKAAEYLAFVGLYLGMQIFKGLISFIEEEFSMITAHTVRIAHKIISNSDI